MAKWYCLGMAFWSSWRCTFYFAHFLFFPSSPTSFSLLHPQISIGISILSWRGYYSLKRSSIQTGTMSYESPENPILRIEMKMHLGLAGKTTNQPFSLACISVDDLWSFWENSCARESQGSFCQTRQPLLRISQWRVASWMLRVSCQALANSLCSEEIPFGI